MLGIFSDSTDQSTSMVIDWLICNGIAFQRINNETKFLNCSLEFDANGKKIIVLKDIEGANYNLSDYSAFWYRRGDWNLPFPTMLKKMKKQTFPILNVELEKLKESLHFFLEQKPHLGSIFKEKYHNKIISLSIAASVGLKIPETLIVSDKVKLEIFLERNTNIITKAIDNIFSLVIKRSPQIVRTEKVFKHNIYKLNEIFMPTLVQKEIRKMYELRIFFLKEDFYAMAIFSQYDEQTQVDFRNYNKQKPNRTVPFALPLDIKSKLIEFIRISNLDTGSIDIIVTPDNEYIFLEVNHIGQFGWVSYTCNYYLEEEIALHLKKIMK